MTARPRAGCRLGCLGCSIPLLAIARRLRQIGQDATEAERSRIRAWQRKGQLLGPATPQFYGNQHTDGPNEIIRTSLSQAEMNHRAMARLLYEYPEVSPAAVVSQNLSHALSHLSPQGGTSGHEFGTEKQAAEAAAAGEEAMRP